MRKFIKKIICILCILVISTSILSCAKKRSLVGSGEKGVVAAIDWHAYDEIINKIENCNKSIERDKYLHMAEEMLMDEACVVPIDSICSKAICRKTLHNIYTDKTNLIHFDHIYSDENADTVNIQLYGEPETLDPGLEHYNSEHTYLVNMYNTLVSYDENGILTYVFLDHYDVSDDGLTWKICLKDNLKWSDGKPLTAKNFEYALKRNAKTETGGPLSFVFNSIEGYPNDLNVKSLDDRTLLIKLSNKCPYFLSLWTSAPYIPLREDIVEKSKDWFLTVPNVTCGPYILKEWNHKESMVYEKNPYYFDADNVKTKRINLMLNTNATSVYSAYVAHNIDFALSIPKSMDDPDIVIYKSMGMHYLKANTKDKIFAGFTREEAKKLRKAIGYLVDRNFMEDMSYGLFEKSYALVNDLFTDSEDKKFLRNTDNYTYPCENGYFEDINLEKAKDLLREIGYHFNDDGILIEDLSFEIMSSADLYDIMSILQADLAKIGINMKIRKRDDGLANAGKYCYMYTGWYPDYNDPLAMLELFTTTNENNTCFIGKKLPKNN